MNVNGCGLVFMNQARGLSSSRGRSAGSGFLDRLKSAADAAVSEKAADTLNLTKTNDGLLDLLRRLTPESRDVLDRMEAGKADITGEEWTGFCKELESLGAISKDDFHYTRGDLHLIPIGYRDKSGEFVKYDTPPMLKNKLLNLYHSQGPGADSQWVRLDENDWKGDPLAYLEDWTTSLYSWRSDLARARNEDGTPKYSDFSPITSQINSCQKVTDLVRGLWKCEAGVGL